MGEKQTHGHNRLQMSKQLEEKQYSLGNAGPKQKPLPPATSVRGKRVWAGLGGPAGWLRCIGVQRLEAFFLKGLRVHCTGARRLVSSDLSGGGGCESRRKRNPLPPLSPSLAWWALSQRM